MTALFLFLSGFTLGAWWTLWMQRNARKPVAKVYSKIPHEHDWEPVDAHRVDGGAITWTAIYCSDCGLYRPENKLGPGEKLSLRFPVIVE